MSEPRQNGQAQAVTATDPQAGGSITRGFLFADLRGYTRFVESRGAAAAADLLLRYRSLVRESVARHAGAEIRTEGDSFYVVFPSVSAAVQCGLAIVAAASAASADRPDGPVAVGVGIHAGETIETPEGFVGGPVNIAARICALAGPGEVLVSDTVRALTQTVLPVSFVPRGRRALKGVVDQVALFAVVPRGAVADPGRFRRWRRMPRSARLGIVGGLPIVAVVALAAAWIGLRPGPGLPPGAWKIGLELPLSNGMEFRGDPMKDAVELAVEQVNAVGGIDGTRLAVTVFDDSGPKGQDPALGAKNVQTMIADPSVLGIIGPSGSTVARSEVPLTNRAGILQCSPAATSPGLTKPRDGALDLRSADPTRINFIRTAPADDIQGPALASFVWTDLGVKSTLVIDDADQGRQIADQFSTAYTKLGGTVFRRALNPGADPTSVLAPLGSPNAPGAVFFGGFTNTGAPDVRAAMVAAGHASVPFVSWDGIQDGSGADSGSFIQLAGASAAGSYFSHATIAPPKADFVSQYQARFGSVPDEYAGSAYACAQVIIGSLQGIASTGPSADGLRDALRASAVDPSHRFATVLGTIGFDANGDSLQQFVTFYQVDMTSAGGKGDWVIDKQQDYGPAP